VRQNRQIQDGSGAVTQRTGPDRGAAENDKTDAKRVAAMGIVRRQAVIELARSGATLAGGELSWSVGFADAGMAGHKCKSGVAWRR